MKTSLLIGRALALAVGIAEDKIDRIEETDWYDPTTNWSLGGPLIEKYNISVIAYAGEWRATNGEYVVEEAYEFCPYENNKVCAGYGNEYGPTPLVAAMRCLVAFKIGNEVRLPPELEKYYATA